MTHPNEWTSSFSSEIRCQLIRPENGVTTSLLVALHGMGQNGDLMARAIRPLLRPGRAILIPDGPLPFEKTTATGKRRIGRAWYLYTGNQDEFLTSARTSGTWLMEQISRAQEELGLSNCPVDLLGFSQGGYLAAILAFDNPSHFRRLISCCSRMKTEILSATKATPIPVLVIHGEEDPAVSIARARESADDLRDRGWDVEFRAFPGIGHKMEPEQWAAVNEWLS